MDRRTQLALNALNRRFYTGAAPEWRATRRKAWPGFARVVQAVRERLAPGAALRVLDVGCGDGRLAAYVQQSGPVEYRGVDACEPLLSAARKRGLDPEAFRFEHADFVDQPPSAALPDGPFDLVALLGVLHHVPGQAARVALLRALGARLASAGVLSLTFWCLPEDPRFDSRVIPWSAASSEICCAQLERGDTLLRFGQHGAPPRYCHFPNASEKQALLAESGLTVLERFRADGRGQRLNEYALLSPTHAPPVPGPSARRFRPESAAAISSTQP